jgi:PAS domain S-box-containing protein
VLEIVKDITDSKNAYTSLSESEENYRRLFNSSGDGILIADITTMAFIESNPAICKMLGYTREEMLTKTVKDIHPPECLDYIVGEFKSQAENKQLVASIPYLTKQGTVVYADISTNRAIIKGQDCNIGFFRDVTQRKLAEKKLQESQERMALVLEGSNLGYWDWNIETNEVKRNARWAEMLGYTLPEIEFNVKQWTDLHHPDDRAAVWESIQDHLEGRTEMHRIEYRMLAKDGQYKWILDCAKVVKRDAQGRPLRMSGTHTDVTESRLIRERLLESEEKFRTLAERCPFAIMIYQDDYWVYVNPAVELISGYIPEEFYKMRFWEVVHPDYRKLVLESGKKRQSGQPAPPAYDLKIIHKAGHEVWVSLSGSSLMYEGKPAGLVTIMDITERKNAEAALQESEARYRLLAENMTDNLWTFDLRTMRYSYLSPAVYSIIGFTPEEAIDFRLEDIMTPPSYEVITKILAEELFEADQHYDPARSRTLEVELYHKDGRTVWTEISVRFVYDDDYRPVALQGVTRDISERKRLQTQLQKSQKMESLGLLAGGVAHDLNNVLSGIVSYPELLLMNLPEDSKLRKPLKTIMESGNRAAAIVQDLLTIARGVAIAKEPLKLNALVSDYFNSPEFKRLNQLYSGVTFRTHLAEDLLNIDASDVHIRKVIMNLIANAAEAVKESGNVFVSTDNRFLDKVINGYEEIDIAQYAVLSIADDGPGISAGDLKNIFEPFYTKKKMDRSGTGLGLSIVWNIMQDHKGYIDVKSDGTGTKFELYFPITRDAVVKTDANLSLASYKGNGESILVVDDIETQREITSRMLDMLGYQYKAVASGEEAIDYLKHHTVDLILLDMIMEPGISGYETYKRIIKLHPGQKTIILSGFSETDDVRRTQFLGAGKYLKKPIMLEKLGMSIKEELKK